MVKQHNYIISVGEVTTGIGIFDMLQAFDRTRRLLPRDCGDTISWSAGCVEKAQPNAIDMPCDTKAGTMHFIRSQYDSVIVQAMMEFFVSHKIRTREVRLWTLVPVVTTYVAQ